MIAVRYLEDRATLQEFALYFVRRVGELESRQDEEEAARTLAAILERNLDIRTVSLLGYGSFGVAAGHKNHVLKLTTDHTEVAAANALVGKKLRHVVRFYQASFIEGFTMVRRGGYKLREVGIVLSEKLAEIGTNDGQGNVLDHIVLEAKSEFGIFGIYWDALDDEDARAAICDASLALEERLFQELGSLREIALGLEELRSHGICLVDTHAKNIGYGPDGVHKIFDVGVASSPQDAVPRMAGRDRG